PGRQRVSIEARGAAMNVSPWKPVPAGRRVVTETVMPAWPARRTASRRGRRGAGSQGCCPTFRAGPPMARDSSLSLPWRRTHTVAWAEILEGTLAAAGCFSTDILRQADDLGVIVAVEACVAGKAPHEERLHLVIALPSLDQAESRQEATAVAVHD